MTRDRQGERILIVEDDAEVASAITEHVALAGFATRSASTAGDAEQIIGDWDPHLVVLDLMLPDRSGESVLRGMRARHINTPVLILSAKASEIERVHGFRIGADDYVTKPFGLLELVARIDAHMRRAVERASATERIVIGPLTVFSSARRATLEGQGELVLRPREFDLLHALAVKRGEAVSRRQLLSDVWGYDASIDSRTVDWHVAELRRKLGDDADVPRLLFTVRAHGYRLGDLT